MRFTIIVYIVTVMLVFLTSYSAHAQSGQEAIQRMREANKVVDETRELQRQHELKKQEEDTNQVLEQQPIPTSQASSVPIIKTIPTIIAKDYWVNASETPVYDNAGLIIGTLDYLTLVTTFGEKNGLGKTDLSKDQWVRLSSLSLTKPTKDLNPLRSSFISKSSAIDVVQNVSSVTNQNLLTNDTIFNELKPNLDIQGLVNCHPSFEYHVVKAYGKNSVSDRACASVCEPMKKLIIEDHYPAMSFILKDYANAATRPSGGYNGVFTSCSFGPADFPRQQHITRSYTRIPKIMNNKLDVFAASLLVRGVGDVPEANRLVKISAELGHNHAQYTYGKILYEDGDLEGARTYLIKAASNGSSHADKSLKVLFDYTYKGEKWFVTAENANVRYDFQNPTESPSKKYPFGKEVEVHEKKGDWYRVSKGVVAGIPTFKIWINKSELSTTKPKREPTIVYIDDYSDDPLAGGTLAMSMNACKNSVFKAAKYRGVNVKTLVDTNTAFMARIPVANQYKYDFVTCSSPDRKRIVERISN